MKQFFCENKIFSLNFKISKLAVFQISRNYETWNCSPFADKALHSKLLTKLSSRLSSRNKFFCDFRSSSLTSFFCNFKNEKFRKSRLTQGLIRRALAVALHICGFDITHPVSEELNLRFNSINDFVVIVYGFAIGTQIQVYLKQSISSIYVNSEGKLENQ